MRALSFWSQLAEPSDDSRCQVKHSRATLWQALSGLLTAICHAPSARGWAGALVRYEALLLRELGYGGDRPEGEALPELLAEMDKLAGALEYYLLADRRGDVMAARARLRELLGRMVE